jgi:hypothetical protein
LVKASTNANSLDIAPFSHPIRKQLLGALTDDQLMDGMHIVLPNGDIRTGPDALVKLLGTVAPVTKKVLTDKNAGSSLQALVRGNYTLIAKHRGLLARFVPNVESVVRLSA